MLQGTTLPDQQADLVVSEGELGVEAAAFTSDPEACAAEEELLAVLTTAGEVGRVTLYFHGLGLD